MKSIFSRHSAFTLVELIVVITILTILGTIGFISLDNYSLRSRDSVRISHFAILSKAFEVKKSKGILLPIPDSKIVISASSAPILFQGSLSNSILGTIGVSQDMKDPKDGIPYTYSVNSSQNRWQILGYNEGVNATNNVENIIPQAHANGLDYSNRYVLTRGDALGIIVSTGSRTPIQHDGLDIDVDTITTDFRAIISGNSEIVGTGSALYQLNPRSSCKRILESGASRGDGIYNVIVRGVAVQVYCDMSTDEGGWTLVLSAGNGSVINAGNTGAVNADYLLSKRTGGKLSDGMINDLYTSQFRTTSSHSLFQDKKLFARLVNGKKWNYTINWSQTEHIKTGLTYDRNANYVNGQGLFQIVTYPTYFAFNHWGDMDVWFSYATISRYFEAPCCVVNPAIYLWVK